jgi:hypothetical protein
VSGREKLCDYSPALLDNPYVASLVGRQAEPETIKTAEKNAISIYVHLCSMKLSLSSIDRKYFMEAIDT